MLDPQSDDASCNSIEGSTLPQ